MPRLVACAPCAILQRLPDVPKGTPLVPARLEWESGEEFVYKDDDGKPLMVPAYDPLLENFVQAHEHHMPEHMFIDGQVINVWQVDQKTWDAVDVVTKIKTELNEQYHRNFEDRDYYRDGAAACYNQHGNPDLSTGCRDFMTDEKMIGQGSYKIDGNVHTVPPKLRMYLCHMCPYMQSYVQVELRRRKGGYDLNKALDHRKRHRRRATR